MSDVRAYLQLQIDHDNQKDPHKKLPRISAQIESFLESCGMQTKARYGETSSRHSLQVVIASDRGPVQEKERNLTR